MSDSVPRGRFVWHELLTSNTNAAQTFYTQLIGWDTTPFEGSDPPYTLWTSGETPLGGLKQLPEEVAKLGVPPHWLAYVSTPDLDATVKQAQKLGAKVLVPTMEIGEVGRIAVLADPQGAAFGVYTPAGEPQGDGGDPQLREFSWHELITTDREAAFEFYRGLFGWKKTEAHDMGEMGIYQMFAHDGGRTLGGMFTKSDDMPAPPSWLLYVRIADVNAGVKQVEKLRGKILNGPMEVPGGDLIAQCLDPQGAAFALHSTRR